MDENQSKRQMNKVKKEASFLDAAERLFMQKGFENTSIDEIAKEAGLTKRTLYQYFLSKEDLFYAVAVKGARLLFAASEEAIANGVNAFDRIRLANLAHLQFYSDNLGLFRILNYKPANQQNCEASPHYREIAVMEEKRMKHLMDIVAEGQTDGSLNTALDMQKAVFYAFYTPFSLLYTISSTDKSIWKALHLDENDFLRFSFDMIIEAMAGKKA